MALDLKDRGYPSAQTPKKRPSELQNAVMTDKTPVMTYQGNSEGERGFRQSDTDKALEKLINAYNNRAFANPQAPMIQKYRNEYIDDNYDSRGLYSGLDFRSHDGKRLGYVNRDINGASTSYGAGIDNLSKVFGDNPQGYFDKEYQTPIGNLYWGYDGDTLGVNLDVPVDNPYYRALYNLMNRGNL